jgi:hypothetical protein
LARKSFDIGLFNALSSAGALGVGWKLGFYDAGLTTTITTYNAPSGGSANTNPVVADANGRFGQIWIEVPDTIKYILYDSTDVARVTRDNYAIADDPPEFDASLEDFLAGDEPLPIASGGTGETSAVNALTALGALSLAGGEVSDDITREGNGVYPYFDNALMTGGKLYAQATGTDPTSAPGDIVFEW